MLDLEQPAPVLDSVATSDPVAPPEENLDPVDPELETQPPEEAEEEDELDGVRLRGKKEALERIKAERLMQADYTRKTQDVAEQRKSFEAERAQFQQTAQAHQASIREVAQLVAIEDRLAQFAKFDFNAAADTDPVQALKLHNEYTQLQAHRAQLQNSITQKQQAQAMEAQRTSAKQLLEARQVLERDIKGWSPDLANKLSEYGQTQGYPPEVLNNVTKPEFVKTLHKAYLYDQLMKQRAAKPAQPAPPVTRVGGGNAAVTKPLSEVSDEEFIRRRREYIKTHR